MGLDSIVTIAINDLFNFEDIRGADIAIVVDYELPIVHIKREKLFPFVTHRQTDGNLHWYAKPSE